MPFTIFAIYCYMLFYSRSASALRIAEVDDTGLSSNQTPTPAPPSCPAVTNYVCSSTCCEAPAGSDGGLESKKSLDTCKTGFESAKTATKTKTLVSFEYTSTNNKQACMFFEKCTKSKACSKDAQSYSKDVVTTTEAPATTKKTNVKGDPHVVNMAGEKFDILATGTFSLLSLTRATQEDLMINGTIARFGAKCGESFITDLEHTGGWIREAYNTGALKIRAVQDTPKKQALQINFGQKWEPLSDLQEMAHLSKAADAVQLDFSSVTVKVSAGKHWRHGWNFLNLDAQGLASLDDNIRVGGLLGHDDHTQVLQADADCAMFAKTAGTDMQGQQSCLSYLKAN